MVITDYRVQSVLRTYSRQLQRSKLSEKLAEEKSTTRAPEEKVTISDEARRKLIMERLTTQVFEKAYPKSDAGGVDPGDGTQV